MLRLDALQFDRHLLAGGHVGSEVNISEGAGADFAAEAIFFADAELHFFKCWKVTMRQRGVGNKLVVSIWSGFVEGNGDDNVVDSCCFEVKPF